MQSKTSLFNKGLFRSVITRFWPLWVIYFLALFIITPMSVFSVTPDSYYIVASGLLNNIWHAGALISFIMAAATAMCVFGFLYNTRHAGMIASLPIKRETVFISVSTAGYVMMLWADALIFIITLLIELSAGVVALSQLWSWLGIIVLFNTAFYGFAVFCAMLTGNLVVLPLVYTVLQLTVVAVETLVRCLLSTFVFGMSTQGYSLAALSPIARILTVAPLTDDSYAYYGPAEAVSSASLTADSWSLLIIYGLSGVVFAVFAFLLYRKRKMETATDVVAIGVLKPVFKYCLCFGCSLVAGVGLYSIIFSINYSNNAYLIVGLFMILGAFIGYFAAEMLIKKTLRVFTFRCRGLYIALGIIVVMVAAFRIDVFGFENKLPNPEEVESVYVFSNESVSLQNPENIAMVVDLHRDILESKELHGKLPTNASIQWVNITYNLKNGGAIDREYRLNVSEEADGSPSAPLIKLQNIFNTAEGTVYRKRVDVDVIEQNINYANICYYNPATDRYESLNITDQQAVELYNQCIVPDMAEGGLGKVWLVPDEEYYSTVYRVSIDIDLQDRSTLIDGNFSYYYDYFSTTLTSKAVRTYAWILENTDIEPVLEDPRAVEGAMTLTPVTQNVLAAAEG